MNKQTFKYEVAFSFLYKDEDLAIQINNLLKDRLKTFIFPEKQNEVAGKDGEEMFNQVFGSEARIVFVLYREGWGKTPWTRIEETAIHNRGFDEGYDFVTFAPLDKTPLPKWLPKNRIWFDFNRWGIEGAASVIEARVQEAGGTIRAETVEEHAARLSREIDAENARQKFLDSENGVRSANNEIKKLFEKLDLTVKHISEIESIISLRIGFSSTQILEQCLISESGEGFELSLKWKAPFYNTLSDSSMLLSLLQFEKRIKEIGFIFDLNKAGNPGWRNIHSKMFYSTEDLAKEIITILLSKIHDYKISKGKDLLGI